MIRQTGVIDIDLMEESSVCVAHAVRGAARDGLVWVVYKTAYGLFADREQDSRLRFEKVKLIATVRHIKDNIVEVTYESDGRVERLFV
jgi:hypothetical protein